MEDNSNILSKIQNFPSLSTKFMNSAGLRPIKTKNISDNFERLSTNEKKSIPPEFISKKEASKITEMSLKLKKKDSSFYQTLDQNSKNIIKFGFFTDPSYFPEDFLNLIFEKNSSFLGIFQKISNKFENKLKSLQISPIFIAKIILIINTLLFFFLIPIQLSFAVEAENQLLTGIGLFIFLLEIMLDFIDFMADSSKINRKSKITIIKKCVSLIYLVLMFFEVRNQYVLFISSLFFLLRYENLKILINYFREFLLLNYNLSIYFNFIALFTKVLWFSHVLTCIWHYLGYFNLENYETWLSFSGISSETMNVRYLESFYYISSVISHVGDTNIIAISVKEKTFMIFAYYCSEAIYFYVLINSFAFLQDFLKINKEKAKINRIFGSFMGEKRVNDVILARNVKKFIDEKISEEKKQISHEFIFSRLSPELKERIIAEFYGKFNEKLIGVKFRDKTNRKLINCLSKVSFLPNQFIYKEKEQNNAAVYLIEQGEVELFIQNPNGTTFTFKKLKKNDIFGESFLYDNRFNETSAKSVGFTILQKLKKNDFLRVIKEDEIDYEKYCFLREKIMLGLDYLDKCLMCKEGKHCLSECLFLRCNISNNMGKIGKNDLGRQKERTVFKRRKNKINSLKINKNITNVKKFMVSEEDEEQKDEHDGCFDIYSDFSEQELEKKAFVNFEKLQKKKKFEIKEEENPENENIFIENAKNFRFFFTHNNFESIIKNLSVSRKKINITYRKLGGMSNSQLVSVTSIKDQSGMLRPQQNKKSSIEESIKSLKSRFPFLKKKG